MGRKLPVLAEQAVGSVQAEVSARSQSFERELRRDKKLSCRPGCSNCCYLPIEISLLEAIPIYRELVQKGRWTPAFVKTLREHAEKTNLLSPAVWLLTRTPCPLLTSDQRCSVYGIRPFHCRTMWATGDPFYCDGQNFGPQTSIVPKDGFMRDFMAYVESSARQAGVAPYTLPVSRALLIAERVVNGSLDARDIILEIARDL